MLKGQLNKEALTRIKDKKDRATVENVLDPRTWVILTKLIKNEIITEVNGKC